MLGIAVAGAGLIGRRHIELIRQSGRCELAAIVDPAPEAAALARDCAVPGYRSMAEMFRARHPDAVIVATPNLLHAQNGIDCLRDGIPVLVEKPIADSLENAERLVDAAERAQVPLLVGHHRRHSPILAKARELVRQGKLGRLVAVAGLSDSNSPPEFRRRRNRAPPIISRMPKLPSVTTMYRALAARDPAFDGLFYVAVKTTRIFCRSVCHARTPKRENVEFYARAQDALYAGYRPCLRCRPLDQGRPPPPLVDKLLAAVEADPAGRLRESDLSRMGIEPSTARRAFQRYCGMTFHAYHRARRMGLALSGVREGKSMLDLQLDHGFDSPSGFREAFAKTFGTPPSGARALGCLYAKWMETPLGPMLALANDDGLHLLEFVDRRGLEREIQALRRRVRHHVVPGEHPLLAQIASELDAYFAGRSLAFATPLRLEGSPFQLSVWNALLAIPCGSTRSYADIAAAIRHPSAVRAVGRANGDNKLSLIVPCHRVVGANGTLTGYGGGLWRKAWLLEHERTHAGGRGQATLPGVETYHVATAVGV